MSAEKGIAPHRGAPRERPIAGTSKTAPLYTSKKSLWERTRTLRGCLVIAIILYVLVSEFERISRRTDPRYDSGFVDLESLSSYDRENTGQVTKWPQDNQESVSSLWSEPRVPKIAIIGAGAGGSSSAFFLSHFAAAQNGLETAVTIYERSGFIGGRSFPVRPWLDDPYQIPNDFGRDENEELIDPPVECGASIFAEANENLHKAARVFNLTLKDHGGEPGGMAIWDGSKFVFTESKGWGWWDNAKMLIRYGRAPLTMRSLVKTTVDNFLGLYKADFVSRGAFSSLFDFARATNLASMSGSTAAGFLINRHKVGALFVKEMVAAATQVNYGTPVSKIHAVGALVSLAATGASQVVNGNRRIFEHFVAQSGSRLRMGEGATVTEIEKIDGDRPKWRVQTSEANRGDVYDVGGDFYHHGIVILAAPFHQTDIRIRNSDVAKLIPPQPYVQLHVSFVITNLSAPQPSYFGLSDKTKMPKAIFATKDTGVAPGPTFNSLNYLQSLSKEAGDQFGQDSTWHVVKMFSEDKLAPETLNDIFGEGNVAKTWTKTFLAYPQLNPIRDPRKDLAPVRPDSGFYYTVSAFNVVTLLLQDLFKYTAPRSWAEWDA
ncbi:BZ3500_MvSof-1268-A1-R1_Chr5-3g08251 [Microbotryum saponariae]|uniref:BZ3500_MvSof-1268-A1-R1_Chr5-3g08251 protein n=1 Tax=Microbotryum saponariae TaxID=289078 RepID=A0A2X0LQX4_9BASI|nr:BZ3500_MvSof-1268-A1-R1_Chr5-3g08251 [Microbotryum saponariae]SDA08359.1 BZ3501_MvSof-1269-A2-R1_Chr5-3g07979 [Microbotryum saponariae]